jgi:hypothetical protein
MADDTKCPYCKGHGCVHCLAALPAGKTCADCAHVRQCRALFAVEGSETWCDFIPSRFRPVPEPSHA